MKSCPKEIKKFYDYRKLKEFKCTKKYIDLCEKIGVEKFIECLKMEGVSLKLNNKQILNEVTEHFKEKNRNDLNKWINFLDESKIIIDLESEFSSLKEFIEADKVPKEEAITSFVIALEKELRDCINKIKSINSENINTIMNEFHPIMDKYEYYINYYERVIVIADFVLKYLIFYKSKDTIQNTSVSPQSIERSIGHIKAGNQKLFLRQLENEWKFLGRKLCRKDQNNIISLCSEEGLDFYLSYVAVMNRRYTEELIATNGINKFNRAKSNEKDEICTLLKRILCVKHLDYQCFVKKKSGKKLKINLEHLVNAYVEIKKMTEKFILFDQKLTNNIDEICLCIDEQVIENNFKKIGIPDPEIKNLISCLTYENYKDIYDTPLIRYNNKYLLIPGVVEKIDVCQVVLSCVNEFNFKGEAFEKSIGSALDDAKIPNILSKTYTVNKEQYQCDVMFVIQDTLYLCECKSWGEPRDIVSYYERNRKCYDAVTQIDRIASEFKNHLDEIGELLKVKTEIKKVEKVIVLSHSIGNSYYINDVLFVDYPNLLDFLKRRRLVVSIDDKINNINAKGLGLEIYDGKITKNRFEKCIKENVFINLTLKNTMKKVKSIRVGNINVEHEIFTEKVSNHPLHRLTYIDK